MLWYGQRDCQYIGYLGGEKFNHRGEKFNHRGEKGYEVSF